MGDSNIHIGVQSQLLGVDAAQHSVERQLSNRCPYAQHTQRWTNSGNAGKIRKLLCILTEYLAKGFTGEHHY
jgi:hypothetical protein